MSYASKAAFLNLNGKKLDELEKEVPVLADLDMDDSLLGRWKTRPKERDTLLAMVVHAKEHTVPAPRATTLQQPEKSKRVRELKGVPVADVTGLKASVAKKAVSWLKVNQHVPSDTSDIHGGARRYGGEGRPRSDSKSVCEVP